VNGWQLTVDDALAPPVESPRAEVERMRAAGATWEAIAQSLNARNITRPRGHRAEPWTVALVVRVAGTRPRARRHR